MRIRWSTLVVLAAMAVSLGASAAPSPGEPKLSRASIEADLGALLGALDATFPRALMTPAAWESARVGIASAAELGPMDRARLCRVLGSLLGRVPLASARMPRTTKRCVSRTVPAPRSALPRVAPSTGDNFAARSVGLFELESTEGPNGEPVVVLGVRRFAPPDDPGWAGVSGTLVSVEPAKAVVVDLRGATGDDPRAVLPLVAKLAGLSKVRPLKDILRAEGPAAEALRRAHEARTAKPSRGVEVWAALVGSKAPARARTDRRPPRLIRVLIGPGCEAACQLVARVLETYGPAVVVGELSSAPNLIAGDLGLFVLPRTGIEVVFPTAAFVLAEPIAQYPSLSIRWKIGFGAPRAMDVLPGVRSGIQQTLAQYARLDRWKTETPTPCAKLPTGKDWRSLPPKVRDRISAHWPAERRSIHARLDLPLAEAKRFVSACPGVEVVSGYDDRTGEMSTLMLRASSYEDVVRLAHSEAVSYVSIKRPHRPELH